MTIRTAIAVALLPVLLSCSSPLDEGTDRIDTQLTNVIKFRSVAVSAQLTLPTDTINVDEWTYDVTSSSLVIDSTASQPAIRLDRKMVQHAPETPKFRLKELRIRIDGARAGDATAIAGDPALGSGVAAVVNIDGREYTTGSDYTASAVFHYVRGTKNGIEGVILIGIDRSPAFTLLLAVNISASQD